MDGSTSDSSPLAYAAAIISHAVHDNMYYIHNSPQRRNRPRLRDRGSTFRAFHFRTACASGYPLLLLHEYCVCCVISRNRRPLDCSLRCSRNENGGWGSPPRPWSTRRNYFQTRSPPQDGGVAQPALSLSLVGSTCSIPCRMLDTTAYLQKEKACVNTPHADCSVA